MLDKMDIVSHPHFTDDEVEAARDKDMTQDYAARQESFIMM